MEIPCEFQPWILRSFKTMRCVNRKLSLLCLWIIIASHNALGLSMGGLGTTVRTWPGGIIYYNFDDNVTAIQQKEFLDAAAEWAMFANVRFILRSDQTDYITVKAIPADSSGAEGGGSSLGMDGGQQFITLTPSAWGRWVICHEIGHALGFNHEQTRSDRDLFVEILWNNVPTGFKGYDLVTNSVNVTDYDFRSVLHAGPSFTGAIDPTQPTMVPRPQYGQYAPVGADDPVLSFHDRLGVANVYGPGPTLSPIVTNTKDSGVGSLRASLYYAYDRPGTTITFQIPPNDPGYRDGVFHIELTDSLPCLLKATMVDGTSQPGYVPGIPLICLDGTSSSARGRFARGLRIRGTNCVVQGLAIEGFQAEGILIDSGARSNLVGGYTPAARNVLVGNGFARSGRSNVRISGTNTFNQVMTGRGYTSLNIVAGNIMRGDVSNPALFAGSGVLITDSARSNLIGGVLPGAGNIISGNRENGVVLTGVGTELNEVQGNLIGVDSTGSTAQGNGSYGVVIGGGARSNRIGGPFFGNTISGNGSSGILIADNGTSGNVIEGNYIGVDAGGSHGIANAAFGLEVYSSSNMVGGASHGAANIISGNGASGLVLSGAGAVGNIVAGNVIGLDARGEASIPNDGAGLEIYSSFNTVGGASLGAANIISGNGGAGMLVSGAGAVGNIVAGNVIGLDARGEISVRNGGPGVKIAGGAAGTQLGGIGRSRNFISGNAGAGVLLSGSSGNFVQGNSIGLASTGAGQVPNSGPGVRIEGGAVSNLIGGNDPGNGNRIAGSLPITIHHTVTSNITIRGNAFLQDLDVAVTIYDGGNAGVRAPTLHDATSGTNLSVSGVVVGSARAPFRLDFYAGDPGPNSPEVSVYLGAAEVIANEEGLGFFDVTLGSRLLAGRHVAATATDQFGNSSTFSEIVPVFVQNPDPDGIPKTWRSSYFGAGATNDFSCASCDPDFDGASNLQEFLANTNPLLSESTLRLEVGKLTGSFSVAHFQSAPNITYQVEALDNLQGASWTLHIDQMVGTGGEMQILDPAGANFPSRFYRLRIR